MQPCEFCKSCGSELEFPSFQFKPTRREVDKRPSRTHNVQDAVGKSEGVRLSYPSDEYVRPDTIEQAAGLFRDDFEKAKQEARAGRDNQDKNRTEREECKMPKQIWTDVGEPITNDLGYGRFLELSKRTNGQTTGLVISSGEYGRTQDGGSDQTRKIYKNRLFVSLGNGAVPWLIKELTTLSK